MSYAPGAAGRSTVGRAAAAKPSSQPVSRRRPEPHRRRTALSLLGQILLRHPAHRSGPYEHAFPSQAGRWARTRGPQSRVASIRSETGRRRPGPRASSLAPTLTSTTRVQVGPRTTMSAREWNRVTSRSTEHRRANGGRVPGRLQQGPEEPVSEPVTGFGLAHPTQRRRLGQLPTVQPADGQKVRRPTDPLTCLPQPRYLLGHARKPLLPGRQVGDAGGRQHRPRPPQLLEPVAPRDVHGALTSRRRAVVGRGDGHAVRRSPVRGHRPSPGGCRSPPDGRRGRSGLPGR